HLIAKLVRELNSKMAEAADTLHRNQIVGKPPPCPKAVERGKPGAQDAPRLNRPPGFGNRRQGFDRPHHVLGVSPVIADARNFLIDAVDKISAPALQPLPVIPAVPPPPHAL